MGCQSRKTTFTSIAASNMKYKVHDLYPKLDFSENQFWTDQRTSVFLSFEKWRNIINGGSMSRITLTVNFFLRSLVFISYKCNRIIYTRKISKRNFFARVWILSFPFIFQNSVKLTLRVPGSNPNQSLQFLSPRFKPQSNLLFFFNIYPKVQIQTIFVIQNNFPDFLWASSPKIS